LSLTDIYAVSDRAQPGFYGYGVMAGLTILPNVPWPWRGPYFGSNSDVYADFLARRRATCLQLVADWCHSHSATHPIILSVTRRPARPAIRRYL